MKKLKEYLEITRLHGEFIESSKILYYLYKNGKLEYLLIKTRQRYPRLFIDKEAIEIFGTLNPVVGEKILINFKGKNLKIKGGQYILDPENIDIFAAIVNLFKDLEYGSVSVKFLPHLIHTGTKESGHYRKGAKIIIKFDRAEIGNMLLTILRGTKKENSRFFHEKYPIVEGNDILSLFPKNYTNFNYGHISLGRAGNSGIIKADLDENNHTLLIGITGSGKSTLALNIVGDIMKGKDWVIIIIDPHGETAEKMKNIVGNAFEISPFEVNGINLISGINQGNIYKTAEDIITILKSVRETQFKDQFFGPRMEDIIVRGIVEISKGKRNTLKDLYKILSERKGINEKGDENSPYIEYINSLEDDEISGSIRALGRLVMDPNISHFICSKNDESLLNSPERNIVIFNFDRGILGYENSKLLSNLFLVRVWQEIQSSRERRKYLIILEEAQDYVSEIISDMVSAGRKFGVNLLLITTSLLSIGENVRSKILSNVGNYVLLRQSLSDYTYIKSLFNIDPKILPQSKMEFLYMSGNFRINGRINENLFNVEFKKREPIRGEDIEIKEIQIDIQKTYDALKEHGGLLFIIPEFYLILNYEKSKIVRILRDIMEKDDEIKMIKRIEIDFKGIKGRYQCYMINSEKKPNAEIDKIFLEFDAYLRTRTNIT